MATKEARKKTALKILKELDITGRTKPITKYSKSVATKILLLIRQGVFFRDAFYAFGLDEITALSWAQDYPEFSKQVHKYRYQALVDIQRKLWHKALTGDLMAIATFLKAADPTRYNLKAIEEESDKEKQPEKIIFVDTILENEKMK